MYMYECQPCDYWHHQDFKYVWLVGLTINPFNFYFSWVDMDMDMDIL